MLVGREDRISGGGLERVATYRFGETNSRPLRGAVITSSATDGVGRRGL